MAKDDIAIIYKDTDILLINKPAGVSVTADRSGAANILQLLSRNYPEMKELRLVHRLDKDTSGVLLIAQNRPAQSFYSRCFAMHDTRKVYIAIARGRPPKERGFISDPIAKNDKIQTVHINPKHGKKAKSFYQLLLPLGPMSLLAVMPITGRTHQIRIHLSHRGLPLAIDPLYAEASPLYLSSFKPDYRPSQRREEESPLINRLTLHAYQLTIPIGPEKILQTFVASLDKKFAAAVKMLAKHTSDSPGGYEYPDVIRQILDAKPLGIDIPPQRASRAESDE